MTKKNLTRRSALKGLAAMGAVSTAGTITGVNNLSAGNKVILGTGHHKYEWLPDWAKLPDGLKMGNTHGCIITDSKGRVYINTDTENAVMIFEANGSYVGSWGKELAGGLHCMTLVEEGDAEFIYMAHHKLSKVYKATLDGKILWTLGLPQESSLYSNESEYRPTSVAVWPDGSFFVADGYGKSFIHLYDAERHYIKSVGGKGTETGKYQTPHGLYLDQRNGSPVVIVADRENHRLQMLNKQGNVVDKVEGFFRRPCNFTTYNDDLAVPDLAGRLTILDKDNNLITHLGDNPDPEKRAKNGIPRELWVDGEFISPHSAWFDNVGNLYVMDWLAQGRISKLKRV